MADKKGPVSGGAFFLRDEDRRRRPLWFDKLTVSPLVAQTLVALTASWSKYEGKRHAVMVLSAAALSL